MLYKIMSHVLYMYSCIRWIRYSLNVTAWLSAILCRYQFKNNNINKFVDKIHRNCNCNLSTSMLLFSFLKLGAVLCLQNHAVTFRWYRYGRFVGRRFTGAHPTIVGLLQLLLSNYFNILWSIISILYYYIFQFMLKLKSNDVQILKNLRLLFTRLGVQ